MPDCLIPPWILPESPETLRWIDDASVAFQPAFGRGMTQRGIYADPRWGLRRRYRGLRSDQQAAIISCLSESRGQFNKILVTPHTPLRGTFPSTELQTNGTFSSGTTGWNSSGATALSVSDRVLRATRTAVTASQLALQWLTGFTGLTAYAPYAARFFVAPGRGNYASGFSVYDSNLGDRISAVSTDYGMLTGVRVLPGDTFGPALQDESSSGLFAGDHLLVPFASVARCALVDNETNVLLRSDELDNTGVWGTLTANGLSSVTANAVTSPDGTTTADKLVENSANSTHFREQTVSITSSVTDVVFGIALKAAGRNFAGLQIIENTSSTSASAWFNLATGAVGTIGSPGANFSNVRTYIVSLGDSWYGCYIVARKTNAATSASVRVYAANVDAAVTYTGNGSSGIYAWRATLAASGVPVRLVQTGSSSVINNLQTGGGIYLKGLPVSTTGLLEVNDWAEVKGQLKRTTAQLNSDAAGLGYWKFRPALAESPAYNDPVLINQPFGRFIYPGMREVENMFGLYGDCEMNLEEIYS